MDPMDDLYEPNEARPAKRVRLEAPLAITEEVQEEVVDDDDWDDIYSNKATPQGVDTLEEEGVRLSPTPAADALPGAIQVDMKTITDLDAAAEPIDEDDELVAPRETATIDEASNKVLEETSQVEIVLLREDDAGKQNEDERNCEDNPRDNTNGNAENPQNDADGTISDHVNGVAQAVIEESATVPPKHTSEQEAEFMAAAAEQKKDQNAEWQFDSSDAESSSDESDSSSDDSSDESDSGSEGGYEMLDPATAAKMLMSGDGEDDDGDKAKSKTGDHQPRTVNEVKDEVVPKPDVVITEDMKTTYLGSVDRTVDNLLLIKAVTPGEYQVLESGSVLCNEKREVIGAVAETLGRVQEPMYSVAFTNEKEIQDMGLEYGAKVFYVDSHSTFVFTQPLKNLKGTDASNIHDEEVGEDELEFSDDEKEAEYKRLKKAAKRGGRGGLSRSAFNEERATRDAGASDFGTAAAFSNGSDVPQQQYGGGMNYDDGDVQDEFYSPLKRPDNLSQLMAGGGPPPIPNRGNFGGRGRGDRGRGRGDRGRGRGGFDHRNQRGGFRQGERRGGNFNQQNGQRGPAHSFPDRHNHGNGGGRANGRKHQHGRPNSNPSQSSSPPPRPTPQQQYSPTSQQQYPPFPQQPPPPQAQPPAPQTYQFNGYTFQYGNPPPLQSMPQMPTAQPQIPAGAYVNPAFFQQQAPQQQQPNYAPWPPQQQYPQYAQPAPQASNSPDLAAILRQLGGRSQQQQQQQQQR